MAGEQKLEVRGLYKAYRVDGRVIQVLEDAWLSVAETSFVSVVGPSGCGKSTLFSIVSGLEEADQGEVWLDGRPVTSRLGMVGLMPQRDLLLPWRSLLANAVLGPEIHGENMTAARKEALELLPMFGLEGFADSLPSSLSGGMRQRTALLRTYLCRKKLMLLDEPFGALDAITRMKLQEWLLSFWEGRDYTVLFVTHDVDEALFLSDRVYVLSERPSHVCLDLMVDLPRPRSRAMSASSRYATMKRELIAALTRDC